ncbi:hypothetical protein DFH06DRAFT_1328116 [Mycena polygramma]|nr:hypothetical protein DFH06DRAFT_1328116 [Mycena polygramma]
MEELYLSILDILEAFQQSPRIRYIKTAIAKLEKATFLLSWRHPAWAAMLDALGHALYTRFNLGAKIADLESGIALHRESLSLRVVLDEDRAVSLESLAVDVDIRFAQRGDLATWTKVSSFVWKRWGSVLHPILTMPVL